MAILDIIALVLFLAAGVYFFGISAIAYLIIYFPIFLFSLLFYLLAMRKYKYGLSEFAYHQGIQFLASLPATMALFEWIAGKKKPFKVTPKGEGRTGLTVYHIYYIVFTLLLALSVAIGVSKALVARGEMFLAYTINIFWAGWWLAVTLFALYISFAQRAPPKTVRRVSQTYEDLEWHTIRLLGCGVSLEVAIANYYYQLMERFP